MKRKILPLFDQLDFIEVQHPPLRLSQDQQNDFNDIRSFLCNYKGSLGTFNSYRRELERLFHWSWHIKEKSIRLITKEDIIEFITFCQKPPNTWIDVQKRPRFVIKDGKRIANSQWKPFVASLSKAERKKGAVATKSMFELSQGAVKAIFAILSTFYNCLIQEEKITSNPVALVKQKSHFVRNSQDIPQIRRLSETQWKYVLSTATDMANQDHDKHERTLFIMTALYCMYLRISELAESERWQPKMNHFKRDSSDSWWFVTVSKGNKQRQIAVSTAMLNALKRWREHLGLPPLPSPADSTPLLPKLKGKGGIKCTSRIRRIVQECFDKSIIKLNEDALKEEAANLQEATVHWLRHTGISDDVKHRPREHVRDDAGHSSSAITDKYIDIELRERHQSAVNKPLPSVDE